MNIYDKIIEWIKGINIKVIIIIGIIALIIAITIISKGAN